VSEPNPLVISISAKTSQNQGKNVMHVFPIRVYYEDTDAGGVVFYANYLKFMERARTEWLRTKAVSQAELVANERIMFIVAKLDIQYIAPATLDQLLTVQTDITYFGRASLHFKQCVLHNQELLAQGTIKVGCVSADTFRVQPLPQSLVEHIKSTIQE
jgi:acyl-CoA thioester hydrolase